MVSLEIWNSADICTSRLFFRKMKLYLHSNMRAYILDCEVLTSDASFERSLSAELLMWNDWMQRNFGMSFWNSNRTNIIWLMLIFRSLLLYFLDSLSSLHLPETSIGRSILLHCFWYPIRSMQLENYLVTGPTAALYVTLHLPKRIL